jgi:subtilisin family serine protease
MHSGQRPIPRPGLRVLAAVALLLGVITVQARRSAAVPAASPVTASGRTPPGGSDGGPIPEPTSAQQLTGDVPAHSVGGASVGMRSASGMRSVVLVDDAGALRAALATGITPVEVWDDGLFGFVANLTTAQTARLRAMPGVHGVEIDAPIRIAAEQVNPPWGLDRIDQRSLPIDSSYTYTVTGEGVTAYVIDSGIWASHSEFTGRIPRGFYWNFGDGSEIWDCNGHGTHVAGTFGGTTYGVAKEVTIVSVKVLDCSGNGTSASVIAGIEAVIDDHPAGMPAVANMSVGGPASPAVAAAGNDSVDACTQSPGRVPLAITVAASTAADDDAWWFSNFGPCNDLFAPGVGVLSAWPGGTDTAWNYMSGTSMASPHVAGVAALVLQADPASTPNDVWAAIDAAATTGAISECCGDPDKLLYVPPLVAPPDPPPPTEPPTTAPITTAPPATPPPATTPPPPPPPPPAPSPVAADLVTVQPSRLYDSRTGPGPRTAGSVTEVQVGGGAGVPADAALAALNVTAVEPDDAGYVTVFPCGTAVPNASNVNYHAGQTIPNAVVVRIGDGGRICVYTSATTGLLVDLNGYAPIATGLAALQPHRLYDSRATGSPRDAGSITAVQVAGAGGVRRRRC